MTRLADAVVLVRLRAHEIDVPYPETARAMRVLADLCAWPAVLAANIAIGAGLCAAFFEGFSAGFTSSGEGFNGEYAPRLTGDRFREMQQRTDCGGAYEPEWKPGCRRAAPGWPP